ncbi:hypothetical protein GCM10020000_13530 [Streptomyces olivoverticillatus]
MSTAPGTTETESSSLSKALAALKELRGRIDTLEQAKREGIAIVGMGCRFPGGVTSPEEFWRLLENGVDAITEVPASRWNLDDFYDADPEVPGRMRMRFGGFIGDVDRFDPYFFGISPREAARMDPQQRLFLQVAWEALEDAGQTRDGLKGSVTGVYLGTNCLDYLQMQMAEPEDIDGYTITGGLNCVIPNRLSYLFDLRGPSITVDTACSSSLVAAHLACQSLRSRECDMAVVGGINLIMSPVTTMTHVKGLPMAEDGRCKTFDARADGYVRGEGVGAVVLKRLSDAQAAGDRVVAVIRGTAVNQDGLTNGLTAPNGRAQQLVIRRALDNARLSPAQVTLIEAHGTGTELGDPIEVEALDEVYGRADRGRGRVCARRGQDEHRSHRGGCGDRRPDEGRVERAAPCDRAQPALREPQPAHLAGRQQAVRTDRAAALARRRRAQARCGQLLRRGRDQCPCAGRTGARRRRRVTGRGGHGSGGDTDLRAYGRGVAADDRGVSRLPRLTRGHGALAP